MNGRSAPCLRRRLGVWLLLPLLVGGCRRSPEQLRARAGVAIALETRHTAAELAQRMARRPDEPCGVYALTGPISAEVRWTVEGWRDGQAVLELNETRRLEIDSAGAIRYVRRVDFLSEHGRTGDREREWRLVDGHLYSRDLNLPFERRQADLDDRDRLLDEVPQVFETLVRATGERWRAVRRVATGWQLSGVDPQAGQRARCGREGTPDPWLTELLAQAEVVDAEARIAIGETGVESRRGSWTFAVYGFDGVRVVAAVDEEVRPDLPEAPIEAPTEVADTARIRLHRELTEFLSAVESRESTPDY